MKGLLKFLIGSLLGAVLGWALGFLRFPLVEKDGSFAVGFLAGFTLLLFILALRFIWKKNTAIAAHLNAHPAEGASPAPLRSYTLLWAFVAAFILLGSLLSSLMIYKQNQFLAEQTRRQDRKIAEQAELIESIRKGNLVGMMSNVLDHVDDELNSSADHKLSETAIARVAALSHSFKPYRYWTGDSLSANRVSPERGQLLLALALLNIDSASFAKLKHDAPFAEADLGGANLKGADLSGVNLKGANLKEADLSGANLKNADLREASLWGAKLDGADLSGANLNRADLRWAELNGVNLRMANLNAADLGNAKARNADFRGASLRYGKSANALLNGSDFTGVDMIGINLAKANLSQAKLTETNLRWADLSDAHLDGADLSEARVGGENWQKILEEWHLKGSEHFQKQYRVISDSTAKFQAFYRLEKIEAQP